MIGTAFALFLLLGSLAAGFGMSRRWGWSSPGRRPHHRHGITRLICGALGAASIILMGVSTLQHARGSSGDPAAMKLLFPTLPPPEPPSPPGEVLKGRFLLHAVLISWKGGSIAPLHGETIEVRWPGDRGKVFRSTVQLGSTTVDYSVEVNGIRCHERNPYWIQGRYEVQARGFSHSSSSSGGVEFPMIRSISHIEEKQELFSVVRSLANEGAVLFDLTPVRDEDPLRPGHLKDFLALGGETGWRNSLHHYLSSEERREKSGFPALALILNLGGISALLLGTAIVLSQLFRLPSLGFVKVAACLILYVGALDRLALRINESRVRDASAPIERRLAACAHLPTTMFFRDTALRDLTAVAADPSAPGELKDMAARLSERER